MHQLRNITNLQPHLLHHNHHTNASCHQFQKKIVHQLDNEGCKCTLCQKVVINEMKQVKKVEVHDLQSQKTLGTKEQYLKEFLNEFYYIDKMNRKIRVLLPEICTFQKGQPTSLITKKKDILPLKLIKAKEKLNAFEIQNFFMEGYIYHNDLKSNEEIMKNHKVTTLKKEYYKFDEYLKNQCIVLVKFNNGSCQMMTPVELSNLFKCKQKAVRESVLLVQTMVCASSFQEIRVKIDLTERQYVLGLDELYERAKNEVKMINDHIKPKDFMFVPQREQRKYEEQLKKKNEKDLLKYIALKLLLIYSLKTQTLLEKCLFKFMKDEKSGNYYLIDLQSYQKTSASKLWGEFQKKKAESPAKNNIKRRPASSPEKLQTRKTHTLQNDQTLNQQLNKFIPQVNESDRYSFAYQNPSIQSSKVTCSNQNLRPKPDPLNKKIEQKLKGNSLFKLQPIKRNSQRTRRLMSSLIAKNEDTSRMLKRFL